VKPAGGGVSVGDAGAVGVFFGFQQPGGFIVVPDGGVAGGRGREGVGVKALVLFIFFLAEGRIS
jgi:hypothetical protein